MPQSITPQEGWIRPDSANERVDQAWRAFDEAFAVENRLINEMHEMQRSLGDRPDAMRLVIERYGEALDAAMKRAREVQDTFSSALYEWRAQEMK